MQAFLNAISVMNNPTPAPMAFFRGIGMASMIFSRMVDTESMKNITPSISTAKSANCQENPMVLTTVKAKNAFNPIPGARTSG